MIPYKKISKSDGWSLFLDRDGVLNERLPGVYINDLRDFTFIPGVLSSLKKAADFFRYIFIVTNQQGIGKGLMSAEDLEMVHSFMLEEINKSGCHVDAVYFCPAVEGENHPDRKPNIGMGIKAGEDFPDVDFSKAVMVGDSPGDIRFGQKLGMFTVFVDSTGDIRAMEPEPDFYCKNLPEFIHLL